MEEIFVICDDNYRFLGWAKTFADAEKFVISQDTKAICLIDEFDCGVTGEWCITTYREGDDGPAKGYYITKVEEV